MSSSEREQNDDGGGYNRPRRPEPETISYLKSLPLQDVSAAHKEVDAFLLDTNSSNEYPQSFAAAISAIAEVQHEVASVAGDEHGSQCLEVLANIALPYSELAARILLQSCQGYGLHMATHRYCSHVLQTIFQLSVVTKQSHSSADLALHEDGPQCFDDNNHENNNLPSLQTLILNLVEELSPHAPQLAIHVCGSHVLRTLLCVLGGVDLVSSHGKSSGNVSDVVGGANLRGRKKNKKKKKKKIPDGAEPQHPGTMEIVYRTKENSRLFSSEEDTPSLSKALHELTQAIVNVGSSSDDGPGELQQLSIHPSAGPLLIVLLRVLTYSAESARREFENNTDNKADVRLGMTKPEPTFEVGSPAYQLACQLLCWKQDEQEQPYAGEVIYGLSGEPRGSHLLETLFQLAPDSFHASMVQCGEFLVPDSFLEYAQHDVSNFCLQTILATCRSKDQAETMLKVVIEKGISSGLVVDAKQKRRGILWRAVELAAKYRVAQESILKAIRIGFGATLSNKEDKEEAATIDTEGATKKKKKQRAKASALDIKDCMPLLIALQAPEQDGGRAMMDVAGCRTLYHLLRFAPRLCEETLNGIIDGISTEELVLIAKDGLGSRCILDGILDGPVQTPIFAAAAKQLLNKLTGTFVALSSDRVGHHIVMKLFRALPKLDDKSKLVEELATQGGNRLSGTAMGRSVMEACRVTEYQDSGAKHWRHTMANAMQHHATTEDDILKDVIPSTTSSDGGDKATKSKRKRKRKRPEKGDGGEKKTKSITVDSIVNAVFATYITTT